VLALNSLEKKILIFENKEVLLSYWLAASHWLTFFRQQREIVATTIMHNLKGKILLLLFLPTLLCKCCRPIIWYRARWTWKPFISFLLLLLLKYSSYHIFMQMTAF
jgi:hypothetical protein